MYFDVDALFYIDKDGAMLTMARYGSVTFSARKPQQHDRNKHINPIIGRRQPEPMFMPRSGSGAKTRQTICRVNHEPEKIFNNPEQHDATENTGFGLP